MPALRSVLGPCLTTYEALRVTSDYAPKIAQRGHRRRRIARESPKRVIVIIKDDHVIERAQLVLCGLIGFGIHRISPHAVILY